MDHQWTEAETEEATRRWKDGESASQIAAALGGGVSRSAVLGKLHRKKVEPRSSRTAATPGNRLKQPKAMAIQHRVTRTAEVNKQIEATEARLEGSDVWKPLPGVPPLALEDMPLRGRCRWPLGDGKQACGDHTEEGRVYCSIHTRQAVSHIIPAVA